MYLNIRSSYRVSFYSYYLLKIKLIIKYLCAINQDLKNRKKINIILIHTLFWVSFFCSRFLLNVQSEITFHQVLDTLTHSFPTVILFYVLLLGVTRFLEIDRLLLFWVCTVTLIFLYALVRNSGMYMLDAEIWTKKDYNFMFKSNIWNGIIFCLLSLGYYYLQKQQESENKNFILKSQLNQRELDYLKAQMNPHFLYNTLNSIYSDAYETNPKLARSILALSEMMRYSFDRPEQKGLVKLKDELDIIDQYLEIQKSRFGEKLNINFEKVGTYNSEVNYILPFVLITVVENVFKHGVFTKRDKPVSILLYANTQNLTFDCKNYKTKSVQIDGPSNGNGIEKIKRMLELSYPNQYKMDIIEDENIFEIKMIIPLT